MNLRPLEQQLNKFCSWRWSHTFYWALTVLWGINSHSRELEWKCSDNPEKQIAVPKGRSKNSKIWCCYQSPQKKKIFFDLESGVKRNVWLIVSRRLLSSEDQVLKFSAFTREAKKQEVRNKKGTLTKSNPFFSFPTNISRNNENMIQKERWSPRSL